MLEWKRDEGAQGLKAREEASKSWYWACRRAIVSAPTFHGVRRLHPSALSLCTLSLKEPPICRRVSTMCARDALSLGGSSSTVAPLRSETARLQPAPRRLLTDARPLLQAWLTVGFAVRFSQAQGLHVDGTRWGLPAKETEIRRRLWAQLFCIDRSISLFLGRPVSIQNEQSAVAMPLNSKF